MLYDLICQVWLKNSIHNQSYRVILCNSVFLTSDHLVLTSDLLILPYNHPLNGARYHTQWLDHRWNWIIKSFSKKSIGNCLFSMILSILAPFVAHFTVFYLFSPPDTLLFSYYCQLFCIDVVAIHVLSICHQNMWKIIIGTFLFIGFLLFFYTLSVIDSDCGVLGHLWSQNDVITPWLRLKAISNCSPHLS
jgi:hypothetical protein